jgi:hypothetical protein
MTLAFVLAQLADLATYHPAHEANPVVLALGLYAPPVKGLLVIGVLAVLPHLGPRLGRLVLMFGVVAGSVGAWSNVA